MLQKAALHKRIHPNFQRNLHDYSLAKFDQHLDVLGLYTASVLNVTLCQHLSMKNFSIFFQSFFFNFS